MTARELLCLIQQTGKKVQSNEMYLGKLRRELDPHNFAVILNRVCEKNKRMPTDFQDPFYYDMISAY